MPGELIIRDSHGKTHARKPGTRFPVIVGMSLTRVGFGWDTASWGYRPEWTDDPDKMFYFARVESVNEKKSFKEAYETRRILLPIIAYYDYTRDGHRPQHMNVLSVASAKGLRDLRGTPPRESYVGAILDQNRTGFAIITRPQPLREIVPHPMGRIRRPIKTITPAGRMPHCIPPFCHEVWLDNGNPFPEEFFPVLKDPKVVFRKV